MKICEEHRDITDSIVFNKVAHNILKRNAENLLKLLEPISIALDLIQIGTCS